MKMKCNRENLSPNFCYLWEEGPSICVKKNSLISRAENSVWHIQLIFVQQMSDTRKNSALVKTGLFCRFSCPWDFSSSSKYQTSWVFCLFVCFFVCSIWLFNSFLINYSQGSEEVFLTAWKLLASLGNLIPWDYWMLLMISTGQLLCGPLIFSFLALHI